MSTFTNSSLPKAFIAGLSGPYITSAERDFFAKEQPLGFILFARNIESPTQVRQLTRELRELLPHPHIPILIDQEGGRVARLKPPHFRKALPAEIFADLAKRDPERACKAVFLNARLMGEELLNLGINVDCAPVADLRIKEAHDIIGDRSYGDTPEQVVLLAKEVCRGLQSRHVHPIIKHIPGHGRAKVDSHESLPIVTNSLDELQATDFKVFQGLKNAAPLAMTAHIVYTALDPHEPATTSKKVLRMIRETIGFDGLLLSDDLSMKALKGDLAELSAKALDAGCDIVLHCNGMMEEMSLVAAGTKRLSFEGFARIASLLPYIPASSERPMTEDEVSLTSLLHSN